MKRFLIGLFVVAAGFAAVAGYAAASAEREYRRLIAVGDAALARDDTFVAVEAFSGAIALRPDAMLAYLKRGQAYHRRGEFQNARRDLRTASELDAASVRVFEALGDVNYALKEYERAADRYADCVRLDDTSGRLFYKLGLAQYQAGHASAAIQPLGSAVALDGRNAEAQYVLGLALRELGRTADALKALRAAIAFSPAFSEARAELATIFRDLGRTRDEIEQLEALAALGPRPEHAVALGLAYAKTGRTSQAVLTLGSAAERFPETPQVYVALGRVWLESAEARNDRIALSKALEALEGALTTADPSSEALALFGRALFVAGDLEAAEQTLLEATARFPVEPSAFLYLADLSTRRGELARTRDALVSYRALLAEDDPDGERLAPAARIADLSMRIDDPATGERWYRRASALNPSDARLLARLGEAAWAAGNRDAARAAVTRAIGLRPDDYALRALQRKFR
ncbi:MAG TPA: tetratricopeptide repeat protein [Vicinamibacterales bacterium]|nr:tetratricopeptide repeat protein [Vicinamibacterales bacterium]